MLVIVGIVGVVLVFGIAVFVHELGHFLFARLRGVGVEAFAIGMGPKIVAWKRGGTEYSLRWLPIGGFVRLHQMIREEAQPEPQEPIEAEAPAEGAAKPISVGESVHADMEALYDKGFITKLLVFGGGVFFNYLTAIAATALLLSIGFERPLLEAWVGLVTSPELQSAGLQMDDRIVEIEGMAVGHLGDFDKAFVNAIDSGKSKDALDVKVRRGGEIAALKLPPAPDRKTPPYFNEKGEAVFGFDWEFAPYVGPVIPYRPAAKAGLKEGDLILEVNGEQVDRWSAVKAKIETSVNDGMTLKVRRLPKNNEGEAAVFTISMVPEESPDDPKRGQIGMLPGAEKMERVRLPVLQALAKAPGDTTKTLVGIAAVTFGTFGKAFKTGNFKSLKRDVGGPLVIFNVTYNTAQKGFAELLQWFINLNLILAIMNLLPIPILDGGFILLSSIEAVVRRPVPVKVLTPIYTFFFFCFITLLVLVSYQDIMNIFFRR